MRKTEGTWLLVFVSMILVLVCFSGTANAKYTNASLKGSWSWQTSKWISSLNSNPSAVVGVVAFDGAGNIVGSFTENNNGTITTFSASGTYSVASNGSGTIDLSQSGNSIQLAFVINSTSKNLGLLVTACTPGGCTDETQNGAAVAQGASTFANASLKGTYEFLTNQWGATPKTVIGLLTFDGVSKVTASVTENNDGTVSTYTASGAYSVNSDGTGTVTLTKNGSSLNFGIAVNSATATNPLAKGFALMVTTCGGSCSGSVQTGTAARQ